LQAEDGIRDRTVTGVQTCALPISLAFAALACGSRKETLPDGGSLNGPVTFRISFNTSHGNSMFLQTGVEQEWLEIHDAHGSLPRSEERRVGEEGRARCGRGRGMGV